MKGYFRVTTPTGFNGNPSRRSMYCKTRNAANELKADIRRWKRERRGPRLSVVSLTEEEKNWLGYAKNRLGTLKQLPEIIDYWLATKGAPLNRTLFRDLRDQFLAMKEGETENRRTLADIRTRLQGFAYEFGPRFVDGITTQEILGYLNAIPRGYSRRNAYKWLAPAFAWAKDQRMLTVNPFDAIDRPEAGRAEPGILAPDEFERLLRTADAQFPKLVPFLACAGFAGLRSSELCSMYGNEPTLRWPDVMFDKQLIVVRSEVAKRTRRASDRRFVKLEPALVDWLKPYRKAEGPVVEFTESWLRKQLRRLYEAADFHPPDNALRHSFASYWLARTGSEGVGKLAIEMGNSEAAARRHYIESLAPGDGDAFFGIRRGGEEPAEPSHGVFVGDPTALLGPSGKQT